MVRAIQPSQRRATQAIVADQEEEEARRKAWAILLKLRAGELGSTAQRGPRIKEAIEGFVADKRRIGRRKTTITEYRRALEQFGQLAVEEGVARLDQLTPTHMEKYEAQLRTTGIALKRDRKGPGRPAEEQVHLRPREDQAGEIPYQVGRGHAEAARESSSAGYQLPADGQPDNYCFSPRGSPTPSASTPEPFFADVLPLPGPDRAAPRVN